MVKHHLAFYATQFQTTELNGVFYRTPSLKTVRAWRDGTPDDFVFAWKASKFITHWKRLSGKSRNSLALIEQRLKILGRKAGPVLFQLPPQFEADAQRLAAFLKLRRSSGVTRSNSVTRAGTTRRPTRCAPARRGAVHLRSP